jgi:hypothetical protein
MDGLRRLPSIGTDDMAVDDGAESEVRRQRRPQIGGQIGQIGE